MGALSWRSLKTAWKGIKEVSKDKRPENERQFKRVSFLDENNAVIAEDDILFLHVERPTIATLDPVTGDIISYGRRENIKFSRRTDAGSITNLILEQNQAGKLGPNDIGRIASVTVSDKNSSARFTRAEIEDIAESILRHSHDHIDGIPGLEDSDLRMQHAFNQVSTLFPQIERKLQQERVFTAKLRQEFMFKT
jgi:hypothetical protein